MRPPLIPLHPVVRYGVAIALIAVAAALRVALNPVWGIGLPYITFYPAVMLVAWLGGLGPGLVATALSALLADYFWISPPLTFAIGDLADMLGLLVFSTMGVVISVLNEAWRSSTTAAFESQQRLAVTLTSIGDGVITTDANGRITRMNPVAQGLVGWSEHEAAGHPLRDVFVIVNEQTRQPAMSPVDRVLETGAVAGLANHTVLVARDGREIPIDDSAAPIRAENGEISGVVMIFRDIAERRRAERQREAVALALRQSEERLRITFASIADAVLVTDEEGRITQLNPVGERLTGWSQADAVGHPIQDIFVIVNEETRQPAPHPVERVLRDGVIAGLANHTVLISKAGDEIPIDDSAAPVRAENGRLLGAVMVFRDITERRQVERERAARARASRELAAIVESSDDAIVSKNLDGMITAWNRAAEQMYGYAASDAIGQSIRIIVPEDLLNEEESVLHRIRRGERVEHFETRRRRKDGTTVPVSITVSPLRDATGAVVGASKVARDITAHKQIETERARLLEAERTARQDLEVAVQQLHAALRAGRMGTWEYAPRTGAVKWSPGLEAIHGYAPGTFPGTFAAFRNEIHPEDRDRVLRAIADAAEQRRDHHIEYRIVRADGAVRWVEGRGQLVLDGSQQPDRMVGVCVDVTERKQSEERFRLAIEAAPTAMIMVDRHGMITYANALAEPLFGYRPDEIVGESIDRLVPARFRDRHPEYRNGFTADATHRSMGAGRDLYALRKNGSEVPVEIGLSPFETDGGTFTVAAVTDISERKHMEAALIERGREAEHANRLKDEFLAMVSHELRTPLNAVLGWADILQRGAIDDARHGRALTAIHTNASRQVQLIDELLDVSRIISGKLRLERATIDLADVVRTAVDVVQPSADRKRIDLALDTESSPSTFYADPGRLQQIVVNLLSNAVKFTPVDGSVHLRVRRVDSQVEIVVTDTGQGIPADFLPLVFEPFRQADESLTRRHGGLGLGLSIVKNLVEAHGGTVSAESAGEGRGSMFSVRLPTVAVIAEPKDAATATLASGSPESPPVQGCLDALAVLVVDDDADGRELVAATLEHYGARVVTAASAAEAFDLLRTDRLDMVLADIAMPDEDGYQLIRRIRALQPPERASIPAAALTSFAREEDRQQALQAGFQLHLTKPIDAWALVRAVVNLAQKVHTQ